MRGVAALDDWLAARPEVAGFVVWEPVLGSDDAAPSVAKRARHARNYWDASRTVSAAMMKTGGDPQCLGQGDSDLPVVWDALFDYAPGATEATACGRTILRELPLLSR